MPACTGGDAVLGIVGLDPQVFAHDVDVDEWMVDALVVIPAEGDQCKAIALAVKDRFASQIAVCVRDLGVGVEDALNDVGIGVYGSHRIISLCLGWKTSTRRS